MPHRFYSPDITSSGDLTLDGSEAHHLIHVLRGSPGMVIEVFDGKGNVVTAQLIAAGKRTVDLTVLQSRQETASGREIILGTAVPKGDRFDWLIEKATELGVTTLVPLLTSRSVVDPRDSKLEKLRQTVIAACKQSGRNTLMGLAPVTSWREFCEDQIRHHVSYIAHPELVHIESDAPSTPTDETPIHQESPDSNAIEQRKWTVAFAVGPEGGFTDDEVAAAVNCGARPISLGPNILRIETAALALAARAEYLIPNS